MLNKFEATIEYTFKNKELLMQAFTHSSFANENRGERESNERLEFLGDAVLELTVSHYLFNQFSQMPEGELTKFRANLVCEPSLANAARKIGLGNYLYLGKGEDHCNGRERGSILADAFEAVIGAIYLDSGLAEAGCFIETMLMGDIEQVYAGYKNSDYKTNFQEIIQKNSKMPIIYEIVEESGPDHNKTFTAKVYHDNLEMGQGTGKSKKEAEQNAAFNALEKLNFKKF